MKDNIKRLLIRTPAHRLYLVFKAFWVSSKWSSEGNKILANKTVYCISPYKTGTTFLSSCFDGAIAKHEAMHYTSMKKLNIDFDKYFVRRLNTLNLKLECSGFLSAYVDDFAKNGIAQDLDYICVLRKPSSWITSAVNHHQLVKDFKQHYFWGNELFWKKHVGVDLANFFAFDANGKKAIAEKMASFYMDFTKKTEKLKNIRYVWLHELQDFLPELGQLLGEEVALEKSEKNKASLKKFTYENSELDQEYERLVARLTAQLV